MGKKIKLTESELHRLIMTIAEQVGDESEEQYHHLTPEKYLELMSIASYNGNFFRKIKQYKDKPLWIDGDLSVKGLPIKNLGPIAGISGSLNISETNVSSISGIEIKGHVVKYDSALQRIEDRQELLAKQLEIQDRRENEEWSIQNQDEIGIKAMALFEYLEGNGEIDTLSEEDREKLIILRRKLEDLEQEYNILDDNDERAYELQETIDETQGEIDELEENNNDVYNMFPTNYEHYGLTQFEVLIPGFKDNEYTVGTEKEMDKAALEYAKSYIDDVGVDGFSNGFVDNYIDEEAVIQMAEDDYEYQVRENPESYFNDDDFELTSEQEERIEQIESQIEDLEMQQNELDTDNEDYDDFYEDMQNQIDTLQEELDNIEVDTDPTEDMIDNKVTELVRDVRRDPLGYLKDYGLDIKDYIDEDELAQGLVDSDGWGIMNGYDGTYDSINIGDESYYIMRIN